MKKNTIVIGAFFVIIPILLYIMVFSGFPISEYPADWAEFATYINGTVGIILSAFNICIFYVLTKTATQFSNSSSGKQLLQNMFQSYKLSIDEFVIDYFRCMEKLKMETNAFGKTTSPNFNFEQAKNRLVWILSITKSFIKETKPILQKNDYDQLKSTCLELNLAIQNLLESNFESIDLLTIFLDKKSIFIQKINEIIYNYGK